MGVKSLETTYGGWRFRSRLEARWAVFFDRIGVAYHYEPEGFEIAGIKYLPDFYLPQWDSWIEVKPYLPRATDRKERRWVEKMMLLGTHIAERSTENNTQSSHFYMLCGLPGIPVIDVDVRAKSWVIKDGHVALNFRAFRNKGDHGVEGASYDNVEGALMRGAEKDFDTLIEMDCFQDNGSDVGLWPMYRDEGGDNIEYENGENVLDAFSRILGSDLRKMGGITHLAPSFPLGVYPRIYFGSGRKTNTDRLLSAYGDARSERFGT
jgi:hypothetical protein